MNINNPDEGSSYDQPGSIYVYSYALTPKNLEPTGSTNLSKTFSFLEDFEVLRAALEGNIFSTPISIPKSFSVQTENFQK